MKQDARCRRKNQRGLAIFALGLTLFVFIMMVALLSMMEHSRHFVTLHKQKMAATYLAQSGIDYASYMIRADKWSGRDRLDFTSPVIEGSGYFRIHMDRRGYGAYRVTSTGCATDRISIQMTRDLSF